MFAVREEPNMHLEFQQPDVPMECGHPGPPVDVGNSFQEVVKVPQSFEDAVQPVHVLTLTLLFSCFFWEGEAWWRVWWVIQGSHASPPPRH